MWIPHSLAGQTAGLACRVRAAVDTEAQPFMNSELVFCPLPWFIYTTSGHFPGRDFHHRETSDTLSLTDLE